MRTFLITFQVIYGITCVPWLFLALAIPTLFHNPGIHVWAAVIYLFVLVTFPIVAVWCALTAWRVRSSRPHFCIWVNLIPMLWVIAVNALAFVALIAVAMSAMT